MNRVRWQFPRNPKNALTLYWVGGVLVALAVGIWAVWGLGVEGFAKLLDAVTRLLGVLVWPFAIFYLLVRYGPSIGPSASEFVSSIREGTAKGFGFEASFKREELATKLTAAITAGELPRDSQGAPTDASLKAAEVAAKAAQESFQLVGNIDHRTIRQAEGSRVLWVDDRPLNNEHERQALEAAGIDIQISTSTENALETLKTQRFDAIISDMGRPPDSRAGYTLLEKLRFSGDRTPYIIYAGSRSPEHQAEARQRGALGCTNRPAELFQMVLAAVQH